MDYTVRPVRASAVLTGSYVAGTVLSDVHEFNQLTLLVSFTKGSLTTAEFKVEFSTDGSTYFQETAQSVSGGTATETVMEHQVSATGNFVLNVPSNFRYVRVSAKGTGTTTNSLMAIDAILARV